MKIKFTRCNVETAILNAGTIVSVLLNFHKQRGGKTKQIADSLSRIHCCVLLDL